MELLFLGTGSGIPSKQRNVSSIALKLLNERNEVWLFDCGEATQHQILRTSLKVRKINKIFITHLHGDHIFGLPGLLSSRTSYGDAQPLTLYGPKGIRNFVTTALKVSRSYTNYPLNFVEFEKPGIIFEDDQVSVSIDKLKHGIDSYGFRIEEKDKPGTLLVEKLKADQVPEGPVYGKIKSGQEVVLDDGRVLDPKDYLGPTIKGYSLAILGDTRPCPNAVKLAKGVDLLVHEATFRHVDKDLARSYHHSTSVEAAKIAKEAGVKQLLLTHISSRYLGKEIKELEEEAQSVFPKSKAMSDLYEWQVKE